MELLLLCAAACKALGCGSRFSALFWFPEYWAAASAQQQEVSVQNSIPSFGFGLPGNVVGISCTLSEACGFTVCCPTPPLWQLDYHHLHHHWSCHCLWPPRGEEDVLPARPRRCEPRPGEQPLGAAAVQREELCHQGVGEEDQAAVLLHRAGRRSPRGLHQHRPALPHLLLSTGLAPVGVGRGAVGWFWGAFTEPSVSLCRTLTWCQVT